MNKPEKVFYRIGKEGEPKVCFCIGPENCNDKTCKLVKDYNECHKRN